MLIIGMTVAKVASSKAGSQELELAAPPVAPAFSFEEELSRSAPSTFLFLCTSDTPFPE